MRRARALFVTAGRRIWRRRRLAAAGVAAIVAAAVWLRMGPLPAGLLDAAGASSTVIVDRRGETLYETRSGLGTRGSVILASALPSWMAAATVAAEDERFWSHWGVDGRAVLRAAWRNVRARRVVEGGSTISQQVVELLRARRAAGVRPRGWWAKATEAVIALRLEHRLSKAEILALYLNLAPYGNQVDGAGRAAEIYFGRPVETLTPAEAAFLAALPQQPSRYNPWRDPAAARGRQQRVLAAMHARKALDADALAHARAERLTFDREPAAFVAPHFVERVLADVAGASVPRRVETTLDARLQRAVRGVISAHRRTLDAHRAHNVAVAVLDNRTGEWLAWEGSGAYGDTAHGGAIDGVISPRQPGSALKPFTYAAAFERGFHPATVLADVPSQFPTAEPGVLYSPRNYDDRYRGPMRVRLALAGSENVPAVALASDIGVPPIARLLRRLGLSTLERDAAHYGLGLTLGNAEVRLDELVAAYAALARGGVSVTPRRLRAIDGQPVAVEDVAERLMNARTAFWVTDVLADAEARAFIFGRGGSLEFDFPVAAKTGTSQAYHDNWALGYTREVTVGVWVGNFDRTPLYRSSGVTGAGPIFHDVMLAAVEYARGTASPIERAPILPPTPDVRPMEVCALSGLTPHAACRTRVTEWVPVEATPGRCVWHHDSDEGHVTIWPEEYRAWARARGLLAEPATLRAAETSEASRPDRRAAGTRPPAGSGFRVVSPLPGALYLIDPTLRPEFQTLALRAAAARSGPLEWSVDGQQVGTARADEAVRWPLTRGNHVVIVRDAAGRTAETRFVVR